MATRTFSLPPVLMKIGKRDNLLKLKDEGEVYFGTYSGYRKQEKVEFERIKDMFITKQSIRSDDFDLVRRDPLEGLDETINGKINLKFKHKGDVINIQEIDRKLNLFQNEFTHLYCLFGFALKLPADFNFDKRLRQFGDHALLFDSKVFLTALADRMPSKFDFDYVSYFSNDFKMKGAFAKRAQYSYQYEYRIATNLDVSTIYIGDVLKNRDSTILIKTEDLNHLQLEF